MALFSQRGVRRFILFQTFLIWQGGFLFYAAVVIPLGTEVLRSAFRQGLVTHPVTGVLNFLGVLFLAAATWDVAKSPFKRLASLTLLICVGIGLFMLVFIRRELHSEMDTTALHVRDFPTFRTWHIFYLWVSTLHWLLAIAWTILTYRAWQAEDRRESRV